MAKDNKVILTPEQADATKKVLNALERVFAAEINGHLPFQSKAVIFRELCDDGLIEPMERHFGGRFPVTATGYQLTHAGRLLYFMLAAILSRVARKPKDHRRDLVRAGALIIAELERLNRRSLRGETGTPRA
jgi:hypothetical protein